VEPYRWQLEPPRHILLDLYLSQLVRRLEQVAKSRLAQVETQTCAPGLPNVLLLLVVLSPCSVVLEVGLEAAPSYKAVMVSKVMAEPSLSQVVAQLVASAEVLHWDLPLAWPVAACLCLLGVRKLRDLLLFNLDHHLAMKVATSHLKLV
jgi:hypothetical protein